MFEAYHKPQVTFFKAEAELNMVQKMCSSFRDLEEQTRPHATPTAHVHAGDGCSTRAPGLGEYDCCVGSISSVGVLCGDSVSAPCIVDGESAQGFFERPIDGLTIADRFVGVFQDVAIDGSAFLFCSLSFSLSSSAPDQPTERVYSRRPQTTRGGNNGPVS